MHLGDGHELKPDCLSKTTNDWLNHRHFSGGLPGVAGCHGGFYLKRTLAVVSYIEHPHTIWVHLFGLKGNHAERVPIHVSRCEQQGYRRCDLLVKDERTNFPLHLRWAESIDISE